MRLVFVLLIAGGLIWAFLEFFPSGEPQVSTVEATEPVEQPAPIPAPVQEESAPALPQAAGNPFSPSAAAGRSARAARVAVAAGLAHGDADELEEALQRASQALGEDRVRTVRLFAAAVGGDVEAARAGAGGLLAAEDVPARERAMLAGALGAGPVPEAEHVPEAEIERAMLIRMHLALAEFDAAEDRRATAARRLGRAVELEIDAPWGLEPEAVQAWTERLRKAQKRHRWDPRGDWEGFELVAQPGDSWISMRKRALQERADLDLSAGLIAMANGSDVDGVLRKGQKVRIPTDPVSVLVDVSSRWLLYRIGDEVVDSYQVGVGREGEETLTGDFLAGVKQKNPMYWGVSPPVPYGDPANPLGTRWIGWRVEGEDDDTSYGLHGTNDPESIGKAASEGCVRMRNEDVELMFELIPAGSTFHVRD